MLVSLLFYQLRFFKKNLNTWQYSDCIFTFNASDVQRRIELIQDFEMPTVSTSIKVSRDGNFILATGQLRCVSSLSGRKIQLIHIFFILCVLFILGTYKPRIRCYDTHQLSLKFERCLDSDGKSEIPSFFYYKLMWWFNIVKYENTLLKLNVKNVFFLSKSWHLTLCLMTTRR